MTGPQSSAKTILVIGLRSEFDEPENLRSTQIMSDTFELVCREARNVDIITFDELLERAQFTARSS